MKIIKLVILLSTISLASAFAQENCLNSKRLAALDMEWEKSLLESNVEFLESTLAEDFIWVHNHASLTDTKEMLIKRANDPNIGAAWNPESRKSRDVQVILFGTTAIVTGYTVVERDSTETTYHFMRTYTELDGKCRLVANHTMVVPDEKD